MRNVAIRQTVVLASIAAALLASACGSDGRTGGRPGAPEVADPATPFVLDRLPEGFVAVAAGEGEWEQNWDTDWGSDEPFMLLGNGEQRVRISSMGDRHGNGPTIGGREVQDSRPGSTPWNLAGRSSGGGIGLQASSKDVDTAQLERLLDAASPEGRRAAPSVDELPEGWEVIGTSDADVVMSIGQAPGPTGAFGVSWRQGDPDAYDAPRLSAVSLPGHAADTEAWTGDLYRPLAWFGDAHGEALTVDERPAAFVRVSQGEGGPQHALLTRREDGSLFVLTSSGRQLLTKDQLIEVAGSVRPATAQEWKELGWSTWGGPDLRPDEGGTEITRGEHGDTEWLLQATPAAPSGSTGDAPAPAWQLDPCIKLIGGERRCTVEVREGILRPDERHPESGDVIEHFVIIRTTLPGSAIRVSTPAGSSRQPLHPLPDGSARVAVVFHDPPALFARCSNGVTPLEFPDGISRTYIDVLGPEGEFLGCAFSP